MVNPVLCILQITACTGGKKGRYLPPRLVQKVAEGITSSRVDLPVEVMENSEQKWRDGRRCEYRRWCCRFWGMVPCAHGDVGQKGQKDSANESEEEVSCQLRAVLK